MDKKKHEERNKERQTTNQFQFHSLIKRKTVSAKFVFVVAFFERKFLLCSKMLLLVVDFEIDKIMIASHTR